MQPFTLGADTATIARLFEQLGDGFNQRDSDMKLKLQGSLQSRQCSNKKFKSSSRHQQVICEKTTLFSSQLKYSPSRRQSLNDPCQTKPKKEALLVKPMKFDKPNFVYEQDSYESRHQPQEMSPSKNCKRHRQEGDSVIAEKKNKSSCPRENNDTLLRNDASFFGFNAYYGQRLPTKSEIDNLVAFVDECIP